MLNREANGHTNIAVGLIMLHDMFVVFLWQCEIIIAIFSRVNITQSFIEYRRLYYTKQFILISFVVQ